MFEPFTVITALTVTAATFGVISILSDYCLSYYRLRQHQKTGLLNAIICQYSNLIIALLCTLNKCPHYVEIYTHGEISIFWPLIGPFNTPAAQECKRLREY